MQSNYRATEKIGERINSNDFIFQKYLLTTYKTTATAKSMISTVGSNKLPIIINKEFSGSLKVAASK